MSSSPQVGQKLFGLFELNDAGTVLYSRVESEGGQVSPRPDVSGLNFYEQVAPFENVEEFRRRVDQFAVGETSADNFNFNCRYGGRYLPVKVLLARVRERTSNDRTKSVLVHIRKGA